MTLGRALALVLSLAAAPGTGRADPPPAPRARDGVRDPLLRKPLAELFPDAAARALALAAVQGRLDEVERLVRAGVPVNYRGVSGFTPLLAALHSPAGFEKLLELGANPNLDYALPIEGNTEEGTVLNFAIMEHQRQTLEIALRHGGDPNRLGSSGGMQAPPLLDAYPHVETMRMLLDAGADVDGREAPVGSRADVGDTAAMRAAQSRDFEALDLLLTRGADYTLRAREGKNVVDRVAAWPCAISPDDKELRKDEVLQKEEAFRHKVIAWLREHGARELVDCTDAPQPKPVGQDKPYEDPRVRALLDAVGGGEPAGAVTPQQLYSESDRFNGTRVAVAGFLVRARCLYQSEERAREWQRGFDEDVPEFNPNDYDTDGLTLLNVGPLLDHEKELAGRNITLQGVFMRHYLDGRFMDLDACGDAALIVDESEVQRLLKSLR